MSAPTAQPPTAEPPLPPPGSGCGTRTWPSTAGRRTSSTRSQTRPRLEKASRWARPPGRAPAPPAPLAAPPAPACAVASRPATATPSCARSQVLHVYVCAALLTHWSAKLQAMEFQELVIFLQHLPTSGWCDTDVAELLSQAFVFKALYHNAPSHLAS